MQYSPVAIICAIRIIWHTPVLWPCCLVDFISMIFTHAFKLCFDLDIIFNTIRWFGEINESILFFLKDLKE